MLMEALLAHACVLRLRHVDLTSRPSRQAANAFYRAFGVEHRDTNVYRYAIPEAGPGS
jgi:ribosomal protein S18 acetylase RimI-like enzyme